VSVDHVHLEHICFFTLPYIYTLPYVYLYSAYFIHKGALHKKRLIK